MIGPTTDCQINAKSHDKERVSYRYDAEYVVNSSSSIDWMRPLDLVFMSVFVAIPE